MKASLPIVKLEADSYFLDGKIGTPFHVTAFAADKKRYSVDANHVMQARCAKWSASYIRYEENGLSYVRSTWHGPALRMIVDDEDQIG